MMTYHEMLHIVNECRFTHEDGLGVRFKNDGPNQYFVQLVHSGLPAEYSNGRKWRISPHMTKSEIVATVFKAYLSWVEHEARESFQFRGQSIFGPHFDVDALWKMAAERQNYEYRD